MLVLFIRDIALWKETTEIRYLELGKKRKLAFKVSYVRIQSNPDSDSVARVFLFTTTQEILDLQHLSGK